LNRIAWVLSAVLVASTLAAYDQTADPLAPQVRWYGEVQIDFRRAVPDEVLIIDLKDGNPVARRPETKMGADGKASSGNPPGDVAVRVCKGLVVDGAGRKAGDAVQVVLLSNMGRNWASPGPLEPGRYLVVGMKARNGLLPESPIISAGTSFVAAESSDEIFGLVIFPTKASTVGAASDRIERIMESLVQALPGASRTNMVRITSFLLDSILPADDLSATVRRKAPVGWEKTLYDQARQTDDSYFRAKSFEVLMRHHVESVEGEFATALMDCADDPDAFASRHPYRGLGPSFWEMGARAVTDGDRDYQTRMQFDRARAIQVALKGKNDNIRYYLIDQVVRATTPEDWAGFVKLLQNPPKPNWQEMLVRAFARWRGDKPTPKIEYGLVDGMRKITNMPALVEFYAKEYLTAHP
jgi:hypothetical protein